MKRLILGSLWYTKLIVAMALLVALAVGAPTLAPASTVILGQSLYSQIGTCSPGTHFAPYDEPGSVVYTVPSMGVITGWSYLGGPMADLVKLKVLRATGVAGEYLVVDESALKTTTPDILNTFKVRIRVKAGDIIGLYVGTWSLCAVYPNGTHHRLDFTFEDPATGTSFAPGPEIYVYDPIDLNIAAIFHGSKP